MATQFRRRPLPTFFDWIEDFPFGPRFSSGEHAIRVEEYEEGGTYVVKAELPGIDPQEDVEISVDHGLLTLHARRAEESKEGKRSEFLYGSFTRSVQLPEGVEEDDITASYDKGVLTVKAPTARREAHPRRIRVSRPAAAEGLADASTPEPGLPGVSDRDVAQSREQQPGSERGVIGTPGRTPPSPDVMGTPERDPSGDVAGSGDFGDAPS